MTVITKREAGDVVEWQPKDKQVRTAPIPPLTVQFLTRLHTEGDDSPYILIPRIRLELIKAAKATDTWTDKRPSVNNLRRTWLGIVKAPGIPHATFHDLRRSAITNWSRCLPANVVQDLAGRGSYETTKRYYAVTTKADMVEARRATERALEEFKKGTKKGTTDPKVTPVGGFDAVSGR